MRGLISDRAIFIGSKSLGSAGPCQIQVSAIGKPRASTQGKRRKGWSTLPRFELCWNSRSTTMCWPAKRGTMLRLRDRQMG